MNLDLKDQTSPSSDQNDWFKDGEVIQVRPVRASIHPLDNFWKNWVRGIPFLLGLLNMRTGSRVVVLSPHVENLPEKEAKGKNRAE